MSVHLIAVRLIQSAPSVTLPPNCIVSELPERGATLRVMVVHYSPEVSANDVERLSASLKEMCEAAKAFGIILPAGVTFELFEETSVPPPVLRETR